MFSLAYRAQHSRGWRFFPRDALLVEIVYDYWTSRFVSRAKMWCSDLKTAVVKCDTQTSDAAFLSFAKRAQIHDNAVDAKTVTEELKRKVYEKSYQKLKASHFPFSVPFSIWKLSDVQCNPSLFDFIR